MDATLSVDAERRIVDWMQEEHAAGHVVSATRLTKRAMQMVKEDKLYTRNASKSLKRGDSRVSNDITPDSCPKIWQIHT